LFADFHLLQPIREGPVVDETFCALQRICLRRLKSERLFVGQVGSLWYVWGFEVCYVNPSELNWIFHIIGPSTSYTLF